MNLLSRTEEILLMVVWRLQKDAYGIRVRDEAVRLTGTAWSLGAVYAPLHRLERKGFVATRQGEPTAERGGRSKVFYELTESGRRALVAIRDVHESLWEGVPALEKA